MKYKKWFAAILIIFTLSLLLAFTIASIALQNEDDFLVFLPLVPDGFSPIQPTPTPIPLHFDDCASQTGNNATIFVPADVSIKTDFVLAVDDEIAVFSPDGSICAGMISWDGSNTVITVWGDDSTTTEVDGLRIGEEMVFKIWHRSESREILVKEVAYALGDGFYAVDGLYEVSEFHLE